MSGRAVYIPPAKRRAAAEKQETRSSGRPARFHGAFTGGFSAGYFNTVGSREGWKPSTEQRREQKLEDFMDDEDHETWGGPTSVRQEYNPDAGDRGTGAWQQPSIADDKIDSMFTIAHQTIGPRLLRVLGWREESGAVFVPTSKGNVNKEEQRDEDDKDPKSMTDIVLSKRRLKKIRLNSKPPVIPPPKFDKCGLGFEPHKDAPEFERYRKQRQERARKRAQGQANVYRLSSLVPGNPSSEELKRDVTKAANQEEQARSEYLAYETSHDFIGTHSSSGFALRDDEDDAYDLSAPSGSIGNPLPKARIPSDEYNTEVFEPEDDSDDDVNPTRAPAPGGGATRKNEKQKQDLFGGALASWASGDQETSKTSKPTDPKAPVAVTMAGTKALSGFKLGGVLTSHTKRYPGPDVPDDYQPRPHVFGPNERPDIIRAIAHAINLKDQPQPPKPSLPPPPIGDLPPPPPPGNPGLPPIPLSLPRPPIPSAPTNPPTERSNLAGSQFSALAAAMKNRFTSGSTKASPDTQAPKAGLYQPPPLRETPKNSQTEPSSTTPSMQEPKKPIKVQRTTSAFVPLPLVCKRFGVPVPKHVTGQAGPPSSGRVTEASYFESEVLASARDGQGDRGKQARVPSAKRDVANKIVGDNDGPSLQDETWERPSLAILKSIFDPDLASLSDDTDLDSNSENDQKETGGNASEGARESDTAVAKEDVVSRELVSAPTTDASSLEKNGQELVPYKERTLAKEDKDGESENESESSEGSHRRGRHRKHRKHKSGKRKRKRSSRSSRRYNDEDSDTNSDNSDERIANDEGNRTKEESDSEADDRRRKERRKRKKDRRKRDHKKRRRKHESSSRKRSSHEDDKED